jgi:hypothetical protein
MQRLKGKLGRTHGGGVDPVGNAPREVAPLVEDHELDALEFESGKLAANHRIQPLASKRRNRSKLVLLVGLPVEHWIFDRLHFEIPQLREINVRGDNPPTAGSSMLPQEVSHAANDNAQHREKKY